MRAFVENRASSLFESCSAAVSLSSGEASLRQSLWKELARQLESVYAPYFQLLSSAAQKLNQTSLCLENFTPTLDLLEKETKVFRQWEMEMTVLFEQSAIWSSRLKSVLGSSQIVEISPPLGDMHDGSAVRKVTFSSGKAAYFKPRSLAPEIAWNEFVKQLGCFFPCLHGCAVDVISSSESGGWMVECDQRELGKIDDAGHFYFAAGVLSFWFWVLGAKDMVFSNFFANGKHPCLIDAETVSYPMFHSPNEYIEKETVIQTGYLPRRLYVKDTEGVCTSGLLPNGNLVTVLNKFYETKEGFVEFRRKRAKINDPYCMPRYCGSSIGVLGYRNDFVSGFRKSFDQLTKDDLSNLCCVAQTAFSDVRPRLAIRSTIFYRELIDQMRFQLDSELATRVKGVLNTVAMKQGFTSSQQSWLIDRELESLFQGSVPRFEFDPERNQISDKKESLQCKMYVNALRLKELLGLISEELLDRQIQAILRSFSDVESTLCSR